MTLTDQFHLTKLDAIVQLRTQHTHMDAATEQEKTTTKAQREGENPPAESEARSVNVTVKGAEAEEIDMTETAKILRARHEEEWVRMKYTDENVSSSIPPPYITADSVT